MEINNIEAENEVKDVNYPALFETVIEVVDACPNKSLTLDYFPDEQYTFEDCPVGSFCKEDLGLINEILKSQEKILDFENSPVALSAVVNREKYDKLLTLTFYNGVLNSYQFELKGFGQVAYISKEWNAGRSERMDVSDSISKSDYDLLLVFCDVLLRDIRNRRL